MRRHALRRVLTTGAILALAGMTGAVGAPKDVIIQKLSFRYVAAPNAATGGTVEIQDNAAIAAGKEEGAFWANPSMASLQGVVRGVLRDDPRLQDLVASVLAITDKPILVMLLDDSATPLTATITLNGSTIPVATVRFGACVDTGDRAWPCANRNDATAAFGGHMTLGAFRANAYDATDLRAVFLHELVHTQDRSDWRGHLFFINGKSYGYGPDGEHYSAEAVPNSAMTYAEGIANTLRVMYNSQQALGSFDWWAKNDVMWVERPTAATPTSVSWVYDAIKRAQPPVPEVTPDAKMKADWGETLVGRYAFFRVRSLPANLIMQNEYILALVFSEWARHVSEPKFMTALKKTNGRLTDVCASSVATLVEELAANSGTGTQRLLPLGFIDYFTGYQATNEDEYAAIFDGLLSKERFITPYFAVRDKVKAAAPQTKGKNLEFGDLTSVAMALGVTSQGQ